MKFAIQTVPPWILSVSFVFFGWLAGAIFSADSSAPEPVCNASSPSTSPSSNEPFIAADANGNITLRVESQPISWVLEQIWLQTGKTSTPANSSFQPTASAEPASLSLPQSNDELLTKIQEGDESERYDTLALAHQQKIILPKEVLRTLYETDQSMHVRLLAYTYAIETFSGDSMALRDTLENARSLPDAAIAQDAEQRLTILSRLELEREKITYSTP